MGIRGHHVHGLNELANGIDKIVDHNCNDIDDSLRARVTNGGGLDAVFPCIYKTIEHRIVIGLNWTYLLTLLRELWVIRARFVFIFLLRVSFSRWSFYSAVNRETPFVRFLAFLRRYELGISQFTYQIIGECFFCGLRGKDLVRLFGFYRKKILTPTCTQSLDWFRNAGKPRKGVSSQPTAASYSDQNGTMLYNFASW